MEKIETLIVEDDSFWQEQTKQALPSELFECVLAENLADAIDNIKNNDFDLIILDLVLPDSTASNTITQIIPMAPIYTPVIITTTVTDNNIFKQAMSLGCEDFILKNNFNAEILLHAVLASIDRRSIKMEVGQEEVIKHLKLLENKFKSIVADFYEKH